MACIEFELGYDQSRFEIEVSESFHCIICFLVLKEPVMCKNQHYYCSFCIKKHLENSSFCPTCLEPLTVDTLKPAPRIVMDYLSELNIRCQFQPRGCVEIVKLKDLDRHVEICGFSPVQCSNEGCNALVNLRDKIYHQSEMCEFRKSKCHDCCQLKQEVKELRVQMLAEQSQMKNELKKEIQQMTFQILTRNDLVLAQQNRMATNVKEMQEQVKNELKKEMKELTTRMFDQKDKENETRQNQIKDEIKQNMKGTFQMFFLSSSNTNHGSFLWNTAYPGPPRLRFSFPVVQTQITTPFCRILHCTNTGPPRVRYLSTFFRRELRQLIVEYYLH